MNTKTVASRRNFLATASATLSAPLAAIAVGTTAPTARAAAQPRDHTALEDAERIRDLHHAYARALNAGDYEQLLELFSEDARVHFEGGTFTGRDLGLRRLYVEHFAQRIAPQAVHVQLLGDPARADALAVAPDGRRAAARFHCLVRAQATIVSSVPLIEMARLQGQGVAEWWEAGCLDNSYVRMADRWRIAELNYRTLGAAEPIGAARRVRPELLPTFTRTT